MPLMQFIYAKANANIIKFIHNKAGLHALTFKKTSETFCGTNKVFFYPIETGDYGSLTW